MCARQLSGGITERLLLAMAAHTGQNSGEFRPPFAAPNPCSHPPPLSEPRAEPAARLAGASGRGGATSQCNGQLGTTARPGAVSLLPYAREAAYRRDHKRLLLAMAAHSGRNLANSGFRSRLRTKARSSFRIARANGRVNPRVCAPRHFRPTGIRYSGSSGEAMRRMRATARSSNAPTGTPPRPSATAWSRIFCAAWPASIQA